MWSVEWLKKLIKVRYFIWLSSKIEILPVAKSVSFFTNYLSINLPLASLQHSTGSTPTCPPQEIPVIVVKKKRKLFICNGNKVTNYHDINCTVTGAKYYDERTRKWKNGKALDITKIFSIEFETTAPSNLLFNVSMNWFIAKSFYFIGHKHKGGQTVSPFYESRPFAQLCA